MPNDVPQSGPDAAHPREPRPDLLQLRAIHRAAAELRRGTPVLLQDTGHLQGTGRWQDTSQGASRSESLVVVAAETAGADGLSDLAALAAADPVLLLSPVRAAALLRCPAEPGAAVAALRTHNLLDPATLRGIADPTAEQMLKQPLELVPAPAQAQAALALAKLARLLPAVLAAPAVTNAGRIAADRALLTVSGQDALSHPDREAARLVKVAEAHVPLADAPDARVVAFRAPDGGIEHLAILIGQPEHLGLGAPPLARVHSECFTGDLLGSLRCDCGLQLRGALQRMAQDGAGVLLYLAQEGRGIGLANKLRAYALQDHGLDTVDANRALGWQADERNFMVAATMLQQLGIGSVRLLTNNPDKIAALAACGITVAAREPLVVAPNGVNDHYLATKARRFGHLLD